MLCVLIRDHNCAWKPWRRVESIRMGLWWGQFRSPREINRCINLLSVNIPRLLRRLSWAECALTTCERNMTLIKHWTVLVDLLPVPRHLLLAMLLLFNMIWIPSHAVHAGSGVFDCRSNVFVLVVDFSYARLVSAAFIYDFGSLGRSWET